MAPVCFLLAVLTFNPVSRETCDRKLGYCSPYAFCTDYSTGFCCHCQDSYYGNGVHCLPKGNLLCSWMCRRYFVFILVALLPLSLLCLLPFCFSFSFAFHFHFALFTFFSSTFSFLSPLVFSFCFLTSFFFHFGLSLFYFLLPFTSFYFYSVLPTFCPPLYVSYLFPYSVSFLFSQYLF